MNRVLGVDPGQVNDPTALLILDQVGREYHARKLERPRLGTSYVHVVDRVAEIMGSPVMLDAELVVDATGVGRPFCDMLRDRGLAPIGVMITSGATENNEDWCYRVPKRNLITTAQLVMQQGRLVLPRANPLSETLLTELRAFRVKISAAGNDQFEGREGEHDDLVLALCLALWRARRMELEEEAPPAPPKGSPAWQESERRRMKEVRIAQVEAQVESVREIEEWCG